MAYPRGMRPNPAPHILLPLAVFAGCVAPATMLPDEFPHSMKGYAMYCWKRDGIAWFTLVTATNRSKAFEELDDATPITGDGDWVRVRVSSEKAARELLRRVPAGEFVMVETVRHPSIAQNTIPMDVQDPDPVVLAALDALH